MNSNIHQPDPIEPMTYRALWKDRYSSNLGENSAFLKYAELEDAEQIIWLSDYDPPWKEHADSIIREDQDIMTGRIRQVQSTRLLPMADNALQLIHTQKYPITESGDKITRIICAYYELTHSPQ